MVGLMLNYLENILISYFCLEKKLKIAKNNS